MKKKYIVISLVIFIITIVLISIVIFNYLVWSKKEYKPNDKTMLTHYIPEEEKEQNDFMMVMKYFEDEGIIGMFNIYSTEGTTELPSILPDDITEYYQMCSQGVTYTAYIDETGNIVSDIEEIRRINSGG